MPSYQLHCLCGAIAAPIKCSRAADFPFPTSLCHCNPCRLATGALYTALPRLTEAPSAQTLERCTRYASLGPTGLQRYFCSRCGTHVCLLDVRDGEWHGGAGAIEADGADDVPDRVRVTGHIFVHDPEDGGVVGARPALVNLRYGDAGADELPCFAEWKEGPRIPFAPLRALAESPSSSGPPTKTETLVAKCHCGGTDLRIRRANYAEEEHDVSARHIPPDQTKYVAYFCACRSCRIANGVTTLQPWTSVPPANISIAATGEKLVFGEHAGDSGANKGTSLKHFWSSKNVCWSFCRHCGALVFYWNQTRPGVVDVAVGILRADEGSLARRWLWWKWADVSFYKEAVDRQIYSAIVTEAA